MLLPLLHSHQLRMSLKYNTKSYNQTKNTGTVPKMANAQVSQLLMQRYSHIPHSPNTGEGGGCLVKKCDYFFKMLLLSMFVPANLFVPTKLKTYKNLFLQILLISAENKYQNI